jgi:hypothetical protein
MRRHAEEEDSMATLTKRFSIRLTAEDVALIESLAARSAGSRPQALARVALRAGLEALAARLPKAKTDERAA